jgi:predicted nucleic acid-binding protein
MKYKLKVYLDTSVISAFFDNKNPERKSLTESFFQEINNYDVFISDITIAEIEKTPDISLKEKMNTKIADFSTIELTDEIESLANDIVQKGAIKDSYLEDAYHIAIAILNNMDFLLSWNFRHIVRKKTRDIVRMICTLNNLKQIEIITPAELL